MSVFVADNLIGEGGCAEVYKGILPGGEIVAIKRLTRGSPEEMTADFLSELGIIVHVDHPNIAKLIGYGVEGGMHLILHLSPHGSLASLLYGWAFILKSFSDISYFSVGVTPTNWNEDRSGTYLQALGRNWTGVSGTRSL